MNFKNMIHDKIILLQKLMDASNGEMANACGISYGSFSNRKSGKDNFTDENYKKAILFFKKSLNAKIAHLETLG